MLNLNEKTLIAYKQKIRAQIKETKARMQMFEAGLEKSGADMRIKYQKNLDEWKSRFKEVEMKLDNLSDSAEENWDNIQTSIDETMKELRSTIDSMTKQFNN
jgi:ribosome-associated translation inhibitor RaiA